MVFIMVQNLVGIITFRVSCRRCKMYCGHARLSVCLSVCLSAAACIHYCTDSDALLGEFAIGARVALLWQHNVNAKCLVAVVVIMCKCILAL